jgi:hypothetical protein
LPVDLLLLEKSVSFFEYYCPLCYYFQYSCT